MTTDTDSLRIAFEAKFPNIWGFVFDGNTYQVSNNLDTCFSVACLEYRSKWLAWQAAHELIAEDSYVSLGGGLFVRGPIEALRRVQSYIMLGSQHPVEREDTRRSLMRNLEEAESQNASLRLENATLQGLLEKWQNTKKDRKGKEPKLASGDFEVKSLTEADKVGMLEKLAEFLNLPKILKAPPSYGVGERITYEVSDIRREIFNPISNMAQFAEVFLYAVSTQESVKIDATLFDGPYYEWYFRGYDRTSIDAEWRKVFHNDSKEQLQLAFLVALALSEDWRPENYKE